MDSDKKIWNDFRNGESYALSHIYYQNVQMLHRYGKKFVNNDELIKDTIQDLFYDIIRNRQKLGETDNILYYLFRSFRRKLLRNIQNQNLHANFDNLNDINPSIIFSAEQKLIEKEELSEREAAIKNGLEKLSPKQREILYYRFTCDFEYDHICNIMQIKYDTARKQVYRALKSLKKAFKNTELFLFFMCSLSRLH